LPYYLDLELGRLLVMSDLGLNEQCQSLLKDKIAAKAGNLRELEKLMCLSCYRQAKAALPAGQFDAAVSAMATAERYCANGYPDPKPFEWNMTELTSELLTAIAGAYSRDGLPGETARSLLGRLAAVAPNQMVQKLISVQEGIR